MGCPTLLFIGAKHNISMASLFYSCGLLINISYCAFCICALEIFLIESAINRIFILGYLNIFGSLKTRDRAVPYVEDSKDCVKV